MRTASRSALRVPLTMNERGMLVRSAARAPPTIGATAFATTGAFAWTTFAVVSAIALSFLRRAFAASVSCLETVLSASETDFADLTALARVLPVALMAAGGTVAFTVTGEAGAEPKSASISFISLTAKKLSGQL